jgi:glycosyltransferase involved in cell wall biosynthesis
MQVSTGMGPLRVLVISHTAQSKAAGQARSLPLREHTDIHCRVLVPDRWKSYGTWQTPERADPALEVQVGRVMWPWTGPGQWYLHWYRCLGQILREFRPDVIHLWEEPWGLVSVQAAWLRNRYLPQTRLISETEQNIDKRLPVPFEPFRAYTLRHADLLVGRTQEAITVARAKGYAGAAAIISYGIDPEIFRPRDRQEARQALGLDGFIVGYVGRLVAEKGLEDLVAALALLPKHVNLALIGSGPLREPLQDLARTLGVSARVHFLPPRAPKELALLMSGFDSLALVSRTTARWKEQFGRVIIEAQACGVPVIGSTSGAIPEVVGKGGVIVRERDPQDLSEAIRRLEQDADWRRALAQAGLSQVQAKYTWQHVSDALHDLYRSVRRRGDVLERRAKDTASAYSRSSASQSPR